MDPDWFAHEEWDSFAPLPWDHVASGVTKSYLRGQWRDVFREHTVGDCHHGACNVCGVQDAPVADCVVKLGELIELRRGSRTFEGEPLELV